MSKSKEPNSSIYQKLTVKDILVIVIGLVALVALVLVVMEANKRSRQQEEQLTEISNQVDQVESAYSTEDVSRYLVFNEINQEGWIEIYNTGKRSIDLEGYKLLVCDYEVTLDEQFHDIKSKSVAIVTLQNSLPIAELFTVELIDPEGKKVTIFTVPELERGYSYGCLTNGSVERGYINVSKNQDNENENSAHQDLIHFSVPSGFYDAPFELKLESASSNIALYYTMDGSKPTMESTLYEMPIEVMNQSGSDVVYAALGANYEFVPYSINKCTTVWVAAFDRNGVKLGEESQSYFIGVKNATDYLDIPILNVTLNPDALFDYYSGIYVPGRTAEDAIAREEKTGAANYRNGWKKDAYIEYYESGKCLTYAGNTQVSIVLDGSEKRSQKSLRFEMNQLDVSQYSSLAGYIEQTDEGNGSFLMTTYPQDNIYQVREYIASQLAKDANVVTKQFQPCVLFVDGEYWGLYMMPKESERSWVSQVTDVPSDEIVLWNSVMTVEDEAIMTEWTQLQNLLLYSDLSISENYRQVAEHIDIQNYVDYLCFNLYLANGSYGNRGITAWRTLSSDGTGYRDGKWRFYCSDLPDSMWNGMSSEKNTPSIDSFLTVGVRSDIVLKALLANDEFQTILNNSMNRMADEIFAEERVESILEQTMKYLRKPVLASHKRFVANTDETFLINEMDKISSFFLNRKDYIIYYTDEVLTGKIDLYYSVDEEEDNIVDGLNQ